LSHSSDRIWELAKALVVVMLLLEALRWMGWMGWMR